MRTIGQGEASAKRFWWIITEHELLHRNQRLTVNDDENQKGVSKHPWQNEGDSLLSAVILHEHLIVLFAFKTVT